MKLIECYIENFGKLSGRKISFRDGINCFLEENGSGKTTLAAFIKVMLYGMSDTKKTSLDENDRKHYLPWLGGKCGGSLTFSANGKTYRVERSFAPKAADDSYALYDTATGRISTDFAEGLGEGLFGIDADGFERTVFLSERALTPKSDNKSISAKLSDLVGCDGDIGGMDEALKLLEEKRKYYYKKGGSGEIADTKARINNISRRLDTLEEVEKSAEEHKKRLAELSAQIEAARGEAKKILAAREDATRRAAETSYEKQYKEIQASLSESERQRANVAVIFGAEIPTHNDIDEASYKRVEAKNLTIGISDGTISTELDALTRKFEGKTDRGEIEKVRSAMSTLKSELPDENDPDVKRARRIFAKRTPTADEILETETLVKEKPRKSPLGIIPYLIFMAIAIMGIFIDKIMIAIGVAGIVLTAIVIAIMSGRAKKTRRDKINNFFLSVCGIRVDDTDEAIARLEDMKRLIAIFTHGADSEAIEVARERIEEFESMFSGRAEDILKEYDRYTDLAMAHRFALTDRNARNEKAERLNNEANAFLAKYKTVSDNPFDELRAKLNEYQRISADISAKRRELVRLESIFTTGENGQRQAQADIKMLDIKRMENEELVASLSREYALTERSYNAEIEELDGREELIMRRGELEELYERHNKNYDTILLTKKYLAEARDNITSKYLGKTKAGFIKYTERIGEVSGESFEMDTDFSVTKQEGATTRAVDAYSRGTRDLYNLSARLALVDSLYEKESPFIILDDPFTAFDDQRTGAAIKALKEIARDRQIIYFTCSKSRAI